MSRQVPQFIDPRRLADAGGQIVGQTDLSHLPRLAQMVQGAEGAIEVRLDFGVDEQALRYVRGQVEAILIVICQRCLEPMRLPVVAQVSLGIVSSDAEADNLPACYDALIATDEPLPLATLLEDELILALPVAPRHDLSACSDQAVAQDQMHVVVSDDERAAASPFAVLASLKGKR